MFERKLAGAAREIGEELNRLQRTCGESREFHACNRNGNGELIGFTIGTEVNPARR